MEQNIEIQQTERTEKQRAASRANGAYSRGPITPAGKAAIARNALHHPLCARTLTLANENPEMLTTLLNDLTAEFQPNTPAERLRIVKMAQAKRKGIGRTIRHYSRNSRRRVRFARVLQKRAGADAPRQSVRNHRGGLRCPLVLQKWHQYRIWLSKTSHLNQKMAETHRHRVVPQHQQHHRIPQPHRRSQQPPLISRAQQPSQTQKNVKK